VSIDFKQEKGFKKRLAASGWLLAKNASIRGNEK
jgi:hypothetical protein